MGEKEIDPDQEYYQSNQEYGRSRVRGIGYVDYHRRSDYEEDCRESESLALVHVRFLLWD